MKYDLMFGKITENNSYGTILTCFKAVIVLLLVHSQRELSTQLV